MTRKLKIEILESIKTLSRLLKQERIETLYCIKTNLAETIGHLSVLTGKHRTIVSR